MTRTERSILLAKKLVYAVKKFEKPVVEQVARTYNPYKVLTSTMLSLRTKDTTTMGSSKRLFKIAPSIEKLLGCTTTQIEKAIYPVGFYKTKAKHLQRMAKIVKEKHAGNIPHAEAELLALPGVGRKTANLVLSLSYNKDAICVDTHVHRISNRFDLVRTKNPEETEFALMKVLPRPLWKKWNMWLVMWGQHICHPVSPKCSICPLKNLCPQRGVTTSR